MRYQRLEDDDFWIEVLPLQPPFPDDVRFIQLEDEVMLAISAADFRTLVGLLGRGDWEGREIAMARGEGGVLKIKRVSDG
jgi:hypothetical protein